MTEEKPYVPVWEKQNLTIKEAAQYSNLGTQRIRDMYNSGRYDCFIQVGRKVLVKRKLFDKIIENIEVL